MAVRYLTTDEAAALARRSRKTIYRAIHCGDLRAFLLRSRYLIEVPDLERWVHNAEVRPPGAVSEMAAFAPPMAGSLAALRAIEEAA
jgi:excisionase family DNA binding protein